MDNYKTQLRYATDADDKAAMYLRWAADALKKQLPSNTDSCLPPKKYFVLFLRKIFGEFKISVYLCVE